MIALGKWRWSLSNLRFPSVPEHKLAAPFASTLRSGGKLAMGMAVVARKGPHLT